jgi:hypothetical protein
MQAASIPEADVALARGEMARHAHLRGYRIEVIKRRDRGFRTNR